MTTEPSGSPDTLTKIDGVIRLQRARQYLTGYYGRRPDANDLEAVNGILVPLESELLEEIGSDPRYAHLRPPYTSGGAAER